MPELQKQSELISENVVGDSETTTPIQQQPVSNTLPNREPIKHLLIGSPKVVTATIHYLQMIGYANVGDWSPLQPIGDEGEVMSILRRYITMR
ncbi:hypothetical protein JYQ62_33725 [Nostoc sp. UHCC 0702]|nr:hypothetical protein JYQ62_33725 [Nostoc sp. UHCC 0702]